MPYSNFHLTSLMLSMFAFILQSPGQAKIHLKTNKNSNPISVTAINPPENGLIVIWKSNTSLVNNNNWKAIHAFPISKLNSAELHIKPKTGERAFFKLSWQPITLPDRLVWISPGEFRMGSPNNEAGRFKDEGPVHSAFVPHGFWMERYEITQQRFQNIMGNNPSSTEFKSNLPVNRVTWHEAVQFCEKLTNLSQSNGQLPLGYAYRLPTETEWEYACRADTNNAYSYGDSIDKLSEYGWWAKNSGSEPEPVGKLKPNPWGLYDMHGNLFEWCLDSYNAYPGGKAFSSTGNMKVLRGGAYYCPSNILRSACRAESQEPNYRWILAGFRVVLAPTITQKNN